MPSRTVYRDIATLQARRPIEGEAGTGYMLLLSVVRQAIRHERRLDIAYVDEKGTCTKRIIWPIAVAYYVQATLFGAWCELRLDYRHFCRSHQHAAPTG